MATATKAIHDSREVGILLSPWVRAMRISHWTKNLLLFVPALIAAPIKATEAKNAAILFLVFSCIASAIYVLNDLCDLKADRAHSLKSLRPLANGEMSIVTVSFWRAWHWLLGLLSLHFYRSGHA